MYRKYVIFKALHCTQRHFFYFGLFADLHFLLATHTEQLSLAGGGVTSLEIKYIIISGKPPLLFAAAVDVVDVGKQTDLLVLYLILSRCAETDRHTGCTLADTE